MNSLRNAVRINVGGNTHLAGAVIANKGADGSDPGNLAINTNSLTYSDIYDHDKARSVGLGGGAGNNPTTNAQQGGNFNFNYIQDRQEYNQLFNQWKNERNN